MSRFVRPESEKLTISDGDWILVKRRLTAGEERHAFARIVKRITLGVTATPELDPEAIGLAKMVAYLLDWSLTDDAGHQVPIRDQPAGIVEMTLLSLDPASFREIHDAIKAHAARQAEALDQEKKVLAGVSASSPTSRSAA